MPLLEKNGLRVEYRQEGRGRSLLLLHSLLTELTVFDGVAPALAAARGATRINLAGFGASAPAVLESVADHADQVAHVMDALGLAPDTDVFGNGFGAFVALELAARHGARLRRLIVADALAAFPEPARVPFRLMAEKVLTGGMAAVLDTAIGRMFPAPFAAAHPEVIAARRSALAAVDPACFARACLALAGLDLGPRLGAIRNPVLVACGALDQTTPPALARELASSIAGARYEEIGGCGHCPMLEQPEALVRLIEAFTRD
jgi:pimeloyl-ACP methyl ester carboxylesterase